MPAAPKSPQSKKPGAPKAKGAVRAKSGCYTCRIRRKKCDEHQNQDGHCETCVRLRLQCLGFGAKRPEWLRESRNVSEMRDKIKGFLAAQGMIKGHSGAAARGTEQVPFLRLEEDSTPSSSESPPHAHAVALPQRALTTTPATRVRHPRPARLDWRLRLLLAWPAQPPTCVASRLLKARPIALTPTWMNRNPPSRLIEPAPRIQSQAVERFPAMSSSFSSTYTANFDDQDLYYLPIDDDISSTGVPMAAFNFYFTPAKPGGQMDELVTHYVGNVMDARLKMPRASLAAIHAQRATHRSHSFFALQDKDTKHKYNELLQVLQRRGSHTEDDALAAISIISSFLFDGGSGAWREWLDVSYQYACSVFKNRHPREILQNCGETTRFIIKAAIWFDVLAAITTQESPRFLHYIRELYSPETSGIYDPSSPELSMMAVMGCENHIVWALAEASELSVWKREQQARGRLSVPDLVARASNLDKTYLQATPSSPTLPPYGTTADANSNVKTETDIARELSSNIFRSATRVYIRSIVSGDFPHVPEIVEGIDETMGYVRAATAQTQKIYSSVVRSTVFAFFICGALTDNVRVRLEVNENLTLSGEDPSMSTVGNSASIRKLLEGIWHERRAKNSAQTSVRWREVLRDYNLLLV
ncbi:hypothetical protein MVEN_02117100 [Mycena venus]|uniref:Zn(2)-C6 fungal-type domain-containing protein n=1 Tax=Mycena venus TaxID=2733690 RepID=A0A8H6X8Y9_9AGAR|nr:hypothetical protein MVEN_02117100 [Mycena venus]